MRVLLLTLLLVSNSVLATTIEEFVFDVASSYSDGFAVVIKPSVKVKDISSGKYLVSFALEGFGGGNSHRSYLALVSETNGEHVVKPSKDWRLLDVIKVGQRGWRFFQFDSMVRQSDMSFLFGTKFYEPADAMCCPTGSEAIEIKIENEMLVETNT
jgi:hypothetical protein